MLRVPRPLGLALSGLVAALQVASILLLSGFGLIPLLRSRLAADPPEQKGPELSYPTALMFRLLVMVRWLLRTNFVGRRLAARYLRRAVPEVRRSAPVVLEAEPLPEYRADGISPEEFFERHCRRPHPAVLRGLHPLARDWSLDGLIRDYGDTEVLFNEGSDYRMRPLRYLQESSDPTLYVTACEQLLIRHPELLDALDVAQYRPWMRKIAYCAQLFIGARKTLGLYFHCANNHNMFTMLHGRKRWTFVHPDFSYLMYPIISKESAYVASIINHREMDPAYWELFAHCPRYEVVLEPGDVLYNPPWWWHQVENLDVQTVGCASRWAGLGGREANRVFSFAQASSPELFRTTVATLTSLLETGGDVNAAYRRARQDEETTVIERVAHTQAAMERASLVDRIYPRP